MKKPIFYRYILLSLLFFMCYALVFTSLHFFTPDIGDVDIVVTPTIDNPEICYVSASINNTNKPYYLLIYENNKSEQWLHSVSNCYNKDSDAILETFLPKDKSKYLLFSGDSHKKTFTFTLKSKYPISYTSNKEHLFILYYIVPLNILSFKFYFHKSYIFFVDPLI